MGTVFESFEVDIKFSGDLVQSESGDFDMVDGLDNVKDALFRRLVTEPGTMLHRPDYGVGIRKFENAPSTLETKRQIALRIKEQFEQDPRVEQVLGTIVDSDEDNPGFFNLIVRIKLKGYGDAQVKFSPFGDV